MRPALRGLALALLPLGVLGGASAQEHPVFNTKIEPPQAPVLIDLLKTGGLVIFFRHGTTPDYAEPSVTDFADCSRQRNLNALGRAQALGIGEAFRELGFKIDKVVASPYCRAMDTARYAFGRVEAAREVGDGGDKAMLRVRFSSPPKAGFNDVIVGHGSAGGMIGEEFLREAEAMIVRPQSEGRFALVARVRAESWTQMLPRNRIPPADAPRAGQ